MRQFLPEILTKNIQVEPYFWNIDSAQLGEVLTVRGWALPFFGGIENFEIEVNGALPDEIVVQSNVSVAEQFPWWPHAIRSKFEVKVSASRLGIKDANYQELTFKVRPKIAPDAPLTPTSEFARTFNVLLGFPEELPPDTLRKTIGGPHAFRYRMGGRTLFRAFERVLREQTGKSFADLDHVVDWGCGPGRIAAHMLMPPTRPRRLTGLDIVKESVEWAASRYGNFFKVCDVVPPLPLQDASVDMVYGYSVFTHVPKCNVSAWVADLGRVLKKNGLLLTTILGELAFAKFRIYSKLSDIESWLDRGISDEVFNRDLEETGINAEAYKNVFLTKSAINSYFSEKFDIVRVIENFHFYQDLIVLRKH